MTQHILPFLIPYTRKAWLVQSATRSDVGHLVDFEGFDGKPVYCSCEAFTIGKKQPCKHIKTIMNCVKQFA